MNGLSSSIIADSFVSFAAFVGLMILRSYLIQRRQSLTTRFLFGINVLAVMLCARVIGWMTGMVFFDHLALIAASIVPLAALVVVEGLLRRHAPALLKWLAFCGGILVSALVVLAARSFETIGIYGLIGLQLGVFLGLGAWLIVRDRDSLTGAENLIVDRLGLSFVLIIPFTLTDFKDALGLTPVRLSGIAILFLCWLAMSLNRPTLSHWEIARSFLLTTLSAVCAGLAVASIAELDASETVQSIAIVLSAVLVAQIYNEQKTLIRDEERQTILKRLAEAGTGSLADFLRDMRRHPLLAEAIVLKQSELGDFDAAFPRSFDDTPVQKKSDLMVRKASGHVNAQDEQLHWFFEKYDASHAMQVSRRPDILVAIKLPVLANTPGLDLELSVVQRFAFLLSLEEAG